MSAEKKMPTPVDPVEFARLPAIEQVAPHFDMQLTDQEKSTWLPSGLGPPDFAASKLRGLAERGEIRSVSLVNSRTIKVRPWEAAEDLAAIGYPQTSEFPASMMSPATTTAATDVMARISKATGPPPLTPEERAKMAGPTAGRTVLRDSGPVRELGPGVSGGRHAVSRI